MSLRDPEFCESLEGFFATAALEQNKRLPPNKVCLLIYALGMVSHRAFLAYAGRDHAVSPISL